MKSYLLLLSLVIYSLVYSLVVYLLEVKKFEKWHISLMTHLPLLIFHSILYISEYCGKNSFYDKEIQKIGKLLIFVFLLIYCMNSYGLISGLQKILWFYLANSIALSMIFISTIRHRFFID